MTEPRKDTRKRDRAAYMRDYRASRKKDLPTLTALATRVEHLETLVVGLVEAGGRHRLDEGALAQGVVRLTNAVTPLASPRPAPKGK